MHLPSSPSAGPILDHPFARLLVALAAALVAVLVTAASVGAAPDAKAPAPDTIVKVTGNASEGFGIEHYDGSWRTYHEGALETDRWQWVAATFDTRTDEVVIYLDGAATGDPMNATHELIPDANAIEIGRNGGCAGDYLEGPMDEVRIESVARSATWLAAQHRSMTDAYVSFDAPERIR